MSNTYCLECLKNKLCSILIPSHIIVLHTSTKLQFWFGFVYLTKHRNRLFFQRYNLRKGKKKPPTTSCKIM